MESPSGPDRGVDEAQEDSTSVEAKPAATVVNENGEGSQVLERLATTSTSPASKKRITPTVFLPIRTEIKKMGVEISDERAEQLKNDIRRLSPEVVSLRERTLGEISLTPDSSSYESVEPRNQENQNTPEPPTESYDEYRPLAEERLPRVGDVKSPESAWWSSAGREEDPLKCESPVMRGDELVKISVDDASVSSGERVVVSDDRTGLGVTLLNNPMDYDDDEAVLPHKSTSISDSREPPVIPTTPTMSRAVIAKLAEDEEIVFTGVNVAHVQLQSSFSSPTTTNFPTVALLVPYPEASPCSSTESAEDPLREADTEMDSDSSETTSMQTAVNPAADTDAVEDMQTMQNVVPSIMTLSCSRMETEQPEAFTEDSAESLALAAGSRDEVRSDGSDSGLGGEMVSDPGPTPAPESDSETSFLDRIPDEILSDKDKTQIDAFVPGSVVSDLIGVQAQRPVLLTNPVPSNLRSPPKSNLKRRLTDCMEGEPNPKRSNPDESQKKRNIHFDAVTVYYFPRAQGFTCVPSQGGSTLGMSAAHTHAERFSLTEHAAEQRRIHRARLAQLRSERAANNVVEAASSSEDPSDDTDEEPSDTEELDIDSYYFLLPVPTWQRRALLRAAGVQKIDTVEKDDCRDIRASRKHCGCGCKGYCDPESCPCSRAHVKCQVDRAGFPCGCSRDGCANSSGRIEFNPVRVRTHFIHTLMRLELEKKHREEDCGDLRDLDNQTPLQGPLRDSRGLPVPMEDKNASCGINGGGFTTLHYANAQDVASCQPEIPGTREDSLDLYAIRDDCYPNGSDDVDAGTQQTSHHHQRKLVHPSPEFGQVFHTFPGTGSGPSGVQQFQQTGYHEYQGYQMLPSTSRAQFHHQFQPVPGAQAFPHYGGYVSSDTMGVAAMSGNCHQASNYEPNFSQEDDAPSQYTNLNSVQPVNSVHPQIGKLEPFSELLAGRYSYYGEVEPQNNHLAYPAPAKTDAEKPLQESTPQTDPTGPEDCDENFGEIIKKSMVETVSA